MDLIFILFLLNASFQTFFSRGKADGTTSMEKKKRWQRQTFNWIKFFFIAAFYQFITLFLNKIFGSFTMYSILKIVVLLFLTSNKAKNSAKIFDVITKKLNNRYPVIMEFAGRALHDEIGIEAQAKFIFAHAVEIFSSEYNSILASISTEQ